MAERVAAETSRNERAVRLHAREQAALTLILTLSLSLTLTLTLILTLTPILTPTP